jgi:uncharacterized protein (UPF0262 family)
MASEETFGPEARLVDVVLDDSIGRSTPDVEHERAVAIFDLLEENRFRSSATSRAAPTSCRCRSWKGGWFST